MIMSKNVDLSVGDIPTQRNDQLTKIHKTRSLVQCSKIQVLYFTMNEAKKKINSIKYFHLCEKYSKQLHPIKTLNINALLSCIIIIIIY